MQKVLLRNKITNVTFKEEINGTWESTKDGNGNVIDSGYIYEYKVNIALNTPEELRSLPVKNLYQVKIMVHHGNLFILVHIILILNSGTIFF